MVELFKFVFVTKENIQSYIIEKQSSLLLLPRGKGQLIAKCPFGVIIWTKIPRNFLRLSAKDVFKTCMGR